MIKRIPAPNRAHQRGMATLLIVLVVGLAVSVTVAASIYALRGDQQRQVTTHSVTSAQAAAWRGVEVVRRYLLAVDPVTMAAWASPSGGGLPLPATVSGLEAIGIPDGNARITAFTSTGTNYQVSATITAFAGSGTTTTSATVEVVYDVVAGSGGGSSTPVCAVIPTAPMVFNGDLNITGGSLGVTNGKSFENIAVNGNINLTNASQATFSGCAKGDVTLSGGGILGGGHVHAEGTIQINQMGNPSKTTLWARNITIGNGVSGGNYTAIKAGAFASNVYDGNNAIGTADVGGKLIPSTVTGGVPWRVGTVLPLTAGRTVVTLANGATFLLDLASLTVDTATGTVTGASSAEQLTGTTGQTLPDTLQFRATAVAGGDISLATLTIDQLWGHYLKITGWSGRYSTILANGNLDIVTGDIGTLTGGGDVHATQAGETWSYPSVTTGNIAGNLYYGGSRTQATNVSAAMPRLRTQQAGTHPGLPGIPFCDTRINSIDVSSYRDGANYIFEYVNNAPQLTIKGVKTAAGQSIDGVYNLATDDLRRIAGVNTAFLTCNWRSVDDTAAHCFRDKTATNAWTATGLTAFPRGVAWFDAALTIDGTSIKDPDGNTNIISTLVSKGYFTVTQSGHGDLYAPNYAGAPLLCDGAFYPTNLCDKTGSASQLVEWEDTDGEKHRGLPIGNMAIVTDSGAQLSGWTIKGNVLLGATLATAAQATNITGSLTVGANNPGSATTVQQGGANVTVPTDNDNTYMPGICETPPVTPGGPTTASVRWSRYR